jgi:hypothetical protein
MPKKAITVGEHIIEIYGHITGLKKEICHMKDNHLKHLKEDVESINAKMDKLTTMIISALGSIVLLALTLILKYYKIL